MKNPKPKVRARSLLVIPFLPKQIGAPGNANLPIGKTTDTHKMTLHSTGTSLTESE